MAIHDATIAIDFDGTVVTHAYPEIGEDAGAAPVLKELTDNGCRLILYSMRHGKLLDRAVEWFRVRGIPLYAVNENPSQKRWKGKALQCNYAYKSRLSVLQAPAG